MALAARGPALVRGLVLSGATAEPVGVRCSPYLALARRHGPGRPRAARPAQRLVLPHALPAGARRADRRRRVLVAGRRPGAAGPRRRAVPSRAWPPTPGPTLILNGELDLLFRLSAPIFAAAARDARRVRLAGATHLANLDRRPRSPRRPVVRRLAPEPPDAVDAADRGGSSTGSARRPRLYWPDPPTRHPEVRCAFEKPSSRPPAGAPASCPPPRRSRKRCCRWSTSRSSSTRSKRPSPPGSSRSSSSPRSQKRAIEDHFDLSYELEHLLEEKGDIEMLRQVRAISDLAQVAYVRQKEQLGLGHAVLMAKDLIGHEPFAVILPGRRRRRRPAVHRPAHPRLPPDPRLGRRGHGGPARGDRAATGSSPRSRPRTRSTTAGCTGSRRLVEKPAPGDAPSNLAVIGRYVLTPKIFDKLEQTQRGAGGEIQLTDAIAALMEEQQVFGYEFEGTRYDAGTTMGWLKASVEIALTRPDLGDRVPRLPPGSPALSVGCAGSCGTMPRRRHGGRRGRRPQLRGRFGGDRTGRWAAATA